MTIEQILDKALAGVRYNNEPIPFYCGTPQFNNSEPTNYIFYNYYDNPINYSGDRYNEIEYYITINVIATDTQKAIEISRLIKSELELNGFKYLTSSNVSDIDTLPRKKRKYQEFILNLGVDLSE